MTSRCPRLPLSALLFAPAFAAACSSPSEPTPDHEPRSVVTHVPITADTHVDFNVVPNQVHGHWDYLLLHPWGKTKVLVRADEADLAAAVGDDVLTSAALELTVKYAWNGWAPDATVSAHAVLQPWEEMGATFNCRNDSNPFNGTEDCAPADAWDMVTGSTDAFDPTPLSTAPIQGDAGGYTVALDITGGVQSILDGTSENLGWAVRKSDEHAAGQLYFYSRNGWLVENPPRIVITTETPTGTSTGGASTSAGAGDTQGTVGGQEGSGGVTSNTTGGSAGTTGEPPGPSGTVQGHLVDALTMEPLVGAAIVIGEQQGFTDNLGTFVLSEVDIGAQLNITGALPGYSTAHKRIDVADGETTVVELCATAAVEDPIADVEMGGTVQTVEDVVVDLPPAAFVDSEGNPVVGEVELTTALLNDTDTIQAAPGGMIADIGAGTEAQLESFGMAEFVFTQDGEELELADGVQVDIELPLSEGHGFAEGEEVALWSFDEDSGVWIQEGTGVVSGDMFLATVDHFSWWNVDQPIENNGCINGRLVDDLGDPIVGANVTLNGLTYIGTMDAVTGPDGGFCVQGLNGGTAELRAFSIDPTFGVQVEWTSGPLVLPDGFACGDAGCIDIGDQTPDFTVYGCAAADVPPYIDLNPTQDVPDPLVDWELRSGGAPIDGGTILGETLFDDRNFCLSYALGDADEIAVDGPCGEVVFPLDGTPGSCGGPDCQVLDADAI
ncbi:MAG: DNRLRE domain-containing protein, partial [Myxococcota bacterium]